MNVFNRTSPLLNRKCLQNKIQQLTPLLKKLEWGANMEGLFRASWSYYANDCRERQTNIRNTVQQHARLLASKGNPMTPQTLFKLPPGLNLDEYIFEEFMTCFRDSSRQNWRVEDSRQKSYYKRGKKKKTAFGPTPEQWFAWKKEIVNVKKQIMESSNPYEKEELMRRLSLLHKLIQRPPLVVIPFDPDTDHSEMKSKKNRKKARYKKRLTPLLQQFSKHTTISGNKLLQPNYSYGYRYPNYDDRSVSSFSADVLLLQQELLDEENRKLNAGNVVTNRKTRNYKQKPVNYSYFNRSSFFNSWKRRDNAKDQKGRVVQGDAVSKTSTTQQGSKYSFGSRLQQYKHKYSASGGVLHIHRPSKSKTRLGRDESRDVKEGSSFEQFAKLPKRPNEVTADPNFINQMPPEKKSKKLKRESNKVDEKPEEGHRPSAASLDDLQKANKKTEDKKIERSDVTWGTIGPIKIPERPNDQSHWGLEAKVSKKFSSYLDLKIPIRKTRSEGALGEPEREHSSFWSGTTDFEVPTVKPRRESKKKEAAPNPEIPESKEDEGEEKPTVKKSRSYISSARRKSTSTSRIRKAPAIKSYYSQLVSASHSSIQDSYISGANPKIPIRMTDDKNEKSPAQKTSDFGWGVFQEDRPTSSYNIPYAPKKYVPPIATLQRPRSKIQQQKVPENTEAAKNRESNISESSDGYDQYGDNTVSLTGTEFEMYKYSIDANATDNSLIINNEDNQRSLLPKPMNIEELIKEFMDNEGLEIWWDQSIKKIFRHNALDHSSFTSIRNSMKFLVPPESKEPPQLKVRKFKMKRVRKKCEQVEVPVKSCCSLCHILHKKTSALRPYMQKMVKQRQQLELRTHYTQMLLNYHRKNQEEAQRQKRVCTREVLTSCFQALRLCESILARKRLMKVQGHPSMPC
ncbi:uncharacterized protein Dana_GF24631 [Drosophila ananassae]|uniref:Uncharacterized protein n=1 Tax=Drosophila ananassae TaxID=7217 RepID=B3MAU0_DROAN|nr:uncharacterized protein LOC6507262 [Drosophila ananassae]EDV39174.1 uncharacterized protein Dana_GF24631 [Drosophila ananassae]